MKTSPLTLGLGWGWALWVYLGVFPLSASSVRVSLVGEVGTRGGAPLSGAHIQVVELGVVAITDWSGTFSLPALPAGEWTILITYMGYRPVKRVVRLREGETVYLGRVEMEEEVVTRGEVEVLRRSPVEPILSNRFILRRQEWERQGVTTLTQLLGTIPGVIVLEGDHLCRISLKGSPPRTTRVELDGVPLNDPATGEADLSEVPFHHLERVEVEFTPIGGRVGLFTHSSSPSSIPYQWETYGSAGSFERREGSIKGIVQRSGKEWSGYLHRETERGDFSYYLDNGTRQKRFNNHLSSWVGGTSGSDGKRLRVLFSTSRRERGVPGLIYSAPTPQAYLNRSRSSLSLQWEPSIFDSNPEIQFYYSQQSIFYHNPPFQIHPVTGDTVYHFGEKNQIRSAQWGGEAIMKKSQSQWSAKLQFTHRGESYSAFDLYRQKPLSGIGGGDSWRSIYQIGGQFSYKLTSFLPNLIGQFQSDIIFYDQPFSKIDPYFATGVSIIYRQVKNWGEWSSDLSWGKSFSPPPLASLFTLESLYAVGNPHLSPEEGNGLNWGINYRGKWARGSFSLRQNLFYRRINNLIVWRRNWQDKFYPQNLDITRAVGGEWHCSWEGDDLPLRWEGGYIINDHRLYRRGDINYLHQVPYTPTQSGYGSMAMEMGHWRFAIKFRGQGRRFSTEANTDPISTAGMALKPYILWDFSLHRSVKLRKGDIDLTVEVMNLAGTSYRIVERTPMPGRSFQLSIDYHKSL